MNIRLGIQVSFAGTIIEAIGIGLDILHHINIGIKTPEGLVTPFHLMIFAGFLVNFVGVLITQFSSRNRQSKG